MSILNKTLSLTRFGEFHKLLTYNFLKIKKVDF